MLRESPDLAHMAIVNDNAFLATSLIGAGFGVDEIGNFEGIPETALGAGIRRRNWDLVDTLLEQGAHFVVEAGRCKCGHIRHSNALLPAVEYGDIDRVRYFVSRGANLNAFGLSYPTRISFDTDRRDSASRLSGLGGDPCRCCCLTPLTAYLRLGLDCRYVQDFLDLGALPNNPAETLELYSHHISPLGTLFYTQRWNDSNLKILTAHALLDAGANPLDTVALMSAGRKKGSSYSALKILLSIVVLTSGLTHGLIAGTAALIQAVRLMDLGLTTAILCQKLAVNPSVFSAMYPPPLTFALSKDLLVTIMPETSLRIHMFWSLVQGGYGPSASLPAWNNTRVSLLNQTISIFAHAPKVLEAVLSSGGPMLPEGSRDYSVPSIMLSGWVTRMRYNVYSIIRGGLSIHCLASMDLGRRFMWIL